MFSRKCRKKKFRMFYLRVYSHFENKIASFKFDRHTSIESYKLQFESFYLVHSNITLKNLVYSRYKYLFNFIINWLDKGMSSLSQVAAGSYQRLARNTTITECISKLLQHLDNTLIQLLPHLYVTF